METTHCPTCNGFLAWNYCTMCGFPPDDPEAMEEFNRQRDSDFAALPLDEQRNATWGPRQ